MTGSLRFYKRLGIVLYYGAQLGFALADRFYQAGGLMTQMGRAYAAVFVLIVFGASTGEQQLPAIKAELYGAPTVTLPDMVWAGMERIIFWVSIAAAGYFFYKGQLWDALVALGFPAWKLWLRLEVRRLLIKSGEIRVPLLVRFLPLLLLNCALFFLILMAVSGGGPYRDLGWGPVQLYPVLFIAGTAGFLLALLAAGGKIK